MSRSTRMETAGQLRAVARGAFVAGMGVIVVILLLIALGDGAQAETVNHDAKVDLPAGKSYHRICELTEADNIEMINRLSPDANIIRYDGEQARLYRYILQTGNRIDGNTGKIQVIIRGLNWSVTGDFEGYSTKFPIPDRLYVVRQPKHQAVYPFFIVDGCVARLLFQFPSILHNEIEKHMRARPT